MKILITLGRFVGPVIPCFGLPMTSVLGLKARVDSSLACFVISYMTDASDSPLVLHLLTSWRCQHGSRSPLFLFSWNLFFLKLHQSKNVPRQQKRAQNAMFTLHINHSTFHDLSTSGSRGRRAPGARAPP